MFFTDYRIKKAFFIGGHLFLIALGLVILKNSIAENAIKVAEKDHSTGLFETITTQSWAFFTRDAKGDVFRVFRVMDDIYQEVNLKNGKMENYFGLIKKDRITNHILEAKFKEMPNEIIKETRILPSPKKIQELIDKNDVQPLTLRKFDRIPKGTYILEYRKPVPWAWFSMLENKINMKARFLVLKNK